MQTLLQKFLSFRSYLLSPYLKFQGKSGFLKLQTKPALNCSLLMSQEVSFWSLLSFCTELRI